MLQVKRQDQITFLRSEMLDRIPGLVHGFSTRRAERTDFTLGPADSPNPIVQINRARFLAAVGAPGWPIFKLSQIHSDIVIDVADASVSAVAVSGDAAVTSVCGVALAVQTADCVPILLADAEGRAASAVHAGWRGTASRIVQKAVGALTEKSSVHVATIRAVIGPHICVSCYEVGEEVAVAIGDEGAIERRPEWPRPHLNLAEANRKQLLEAGVSESQIEVSQLCTKCRADLFHSFRRDGKRMGRLLAAIGLAERASHDG